MRLSRIDDRVSEEWISQKLLTLYEGYGPDVTFNTEETGLLYYMIAANMTLSNIRNLLVIGISRSFSNVRLLPVTHNNKD